MEILILVVLSILIYKYIIWQFCIAPLLIYKKSKMELCNQYEMISFHLTPSNIQKLFEKIVNELEKEGFVLSLTLADQAA